MYVVWDAFAEKWVSTYIQLTQFTQYHWTRDLDEAEKFKNNEQAITRLNHVTAIAGRIGDC